MLLLLFCLVKEGLAASIRKWVLLCIYECMYIESLQSSTGLNTVGPV